MSERKACSDTISDFGFQISDLRKSNLSKLKIAEQNRNKTKAKLLGFRSGTIYEAMTLIFYHIGQVLTTGT